MYVSKLMNDYCGRLSLRTNKAQTSVSLDQPFLFLLDLPIGRILTLDLLLNNWDRLPIVWENEGNPNNIIFSKSGNAWGIDQVNRTVPLNIQ